MKRTQPRAARAVVLATGILVGLGSGCLNPRPEDFPSNGSSEDSTVDAPEYQPPPDDLGSSPGNGGVPTDTPPAGPSEPPPDAGAPDAGSKASPDAGTGCSDADIAAD